MSNIGPVIRQARQELDLSQSEVAEFTGTSLRSLIQIERSQGNPTLKQIEKILDFLGLEMKIEARNK